MIYPHLSPKDVTYYRHKCQSFMSDSLQPHELSQPARFLSPLDSPGKNTGMGSHSILQGIFPIQGLNLGLPHCRQILYPYKARVSKDLTTIQKDYKPVMSGNPLLQNNCFIYFAHTYLYYMLVISSLQQKGKSNSCFTYYTYIEGFPGGSDSKESCCNSGDQGSIPRSGRSPGEGNGYPLQYSCLENSMDRGAW